MTSLTSYIMGPSSSNSSEIFASLQPLLGLGFVHSFVSSFLVIAVSEIGDKTFFMAAIFAMKFSRLVVFFGSLFALALMTVLSALLGYVATIFSRNVTRVICSVLFMLFGFKMFHEGYTMESGCGMKDFQSVQEELESKEQSLEAVEPPPPTERPAEGIAAFETVAKHGRLFRSFFSPVFVQSFILTFLAEWGDRSQLSTVVLAANNNFTGVLLGGICGHAVCTGSAVLAGRFIAQRVSLKTVHYMGGFIFITSGLLSLILD